MRTSLLIYTSSAYNTASGLGISALPHSSSINLLEEKSLGNRTALDLEYRPWMPLDMLIGESMPLVGGEERFVAVDPAAPPSDVI